MQTVQVACGEPRQLRPKGTTRFLLDRTRAVSPCLRPLPLRHIMAGAFALFISVNE